jgi:hypothetical protein
MASTDLEGIMKQAEALPPDEQLRLIAHLAEKARQAYGVAPVRRRWSELRGAAQYPMVGEDAQDWVSRTRKESEEDRAGGRESVS